MLGRILELLEGRSQESREGRRLLHLVRSRLLHLQCRYVGYGSWYSPRIKEQQRQQGYLGLVMR